MKFRPAPQIVLSAKIAAAVAIAAGIAGLALSPVIGPAAFDSLWAVEPPAYISVGLLVFGLAAAALAYAGHGRDEPASPEEQTREWMEATEQFFRMVDHDLGRPLRRIAGKERELRAALRAAGGADNPEVQELLDEIERQVPNFRLMLSNIQVLVQLESPGGPLPAAAVEPAAVVRRIVERYVPVAAESGKAVTWWAEPAEFGVMLSDAHAIEHIVANLVDNAVAHAAASVEVSLYKDATHFYVSVWDDGPGIPPQYREYVFDRGWTPEVGRREEKTSSGLGLFIARTLARRCGGELTVESAVAPPESHTAFLLALPLGGK